jgi:predicted NBD/HSP70 family sugar kinase/SAM-dependent methyltransferase
VADVSAVGLELGGTWLRGCVVSEGGATGTCIRERTPDDPRALGPALASLWERCGALPTVGLASAPELDERGFVRRWPSSRWHEGADVCGALRGRGLSPVVMDDASAAAVAEHRAATADADAEGAGPPSSTVLLSVGTGVGGGAVLGGTPWLGARGAAMDVGHMPVPSAAGVRCACGRMGCLQAVVSGRRLQQEAAALGLAVEVLDELAMAGDRRAIELLAGAIPALTEAVVILDRVFAPDRVIVGGGVGAGRYLFDRLRAAAGAAGCAAPVVRARTGTWAGAVGAALEAARRAGIPPPATAPRIRPREAGSPDALFELTLSGRQGVALLLAIGSGLLDELRGDGLPLDAAADRAGLDRDAARIVLGLLGRLGHVGEAAGVVSLRPWLREALDGPWGQMARLQALMFLATPEGREWMAAARGAAFADTTAWTAIPGARSLYPEAMRRAGGEIALRTLRRLRPFPRGAVVLDAGGGTGTFGVPLLRSFEGVRWVPVDLPPMEAVANALADRENARDRCEFIAWDLRRGLPDRHRRCDAVILSQILHLLDPAARARLLAESVERLAPGGKIAVLDFFPDRRDGAPLAPWLMAMDWLRHGTMFHESAGQVAATLEAHGTAPASIWPMGTAGSTLIVASRRA